jgi:hypothetical protein
MDGSGLLQVLVTLAVILLAILALGRAYRKSSGNAQGEDHPEARDGAPEHHRANEPYAFGLRREEMGAEAASTEAARPSPWHREDSRAIRKAARRLYRARFWKIMPLFAAAVLLEFAAGAVAGETGAPVSPLRYLCMLLLGWLLSPVVSAGSAFAALEIWRGKAPRPGMLAAFLRPRRFLRAMCLALIQALAQALSALLMIGGLAALAGSMASASFFLGAWVLPVLMIMIGCGSLIWVNLRTLLSFFALANDPDSSASEAFETGFRATRGRLRPLLGMALATGWPILLIAILAGTASVLVRLERLSTLTDWAFTALLSLYSGYLWLTSAGLADRLLAKESAQAPGEPPSGGEASNPAQSDEPEGDGSA